MATKICVSCSTEKDIGEFCFKNKSKGTRQSRCKLCYSEYNRQYYSTGENVNQIKRAQQNSKKYRQRYQEWKALQHCEVCNEDAPECLDLHHLDPTKKDDGVSIMVQQGVSWDTILKEIAKCAVLCSNCHRKVHSGRITLPRRPIG